MSMIMADLDLLRDINNAYGHLADLPGARAAHDAVAELRRGAGGQFCPRCWTILERLVETGELADFGIQPPILASVS